MQHHFTPPFLYSSPNPTWNQCCRSSSQARELPHQPVVPQFIPPSEWFNINLSLLQIAFILNRKGFYTNCSLYKPLQFLKQSNTSRTQERLTHIASLALFPSTEIVFTLKSTPRGGKIFQFFKHTTAIFEGKLKRKEKNKNQTQETSCVLTGAGRVSFISCL